jgi:hypothetical protein
MTAHRAAIEKEIAQLYLPKTYTPTKSQEHKDYEFAAANSDAFALLRMPNYVYHRGQKNRSGKDRMMVNILFSINNAYEYPIQEIIEDSEIDEIQRADDILKKRI